MENHSEILKDIRELKEEVELLTQEATKDHDLAFSYLFMLSEKLSQLEERYSGNEALKAQEEEVESSLLSRRELEVLGLAAQGQPSKEIAYLLDISMRTVQFHMSSIFKKLEVGSRTEAVARAHQLKILK